MPSSDTCHSDVPLSASNAYTESFSVATNTTLCVAPCTLSAARYSGWASTLPSVARKRSLPKPLDRKSTRLNSSHDQISYAVFCLKKKNTILIYNHWQLWYANACLKLTGARFVPSVADPRKSQHRYTGDMSLDHRRIYSIPCAVSHTLWTVEEQSVN